MKINSKIPVFLKKPAIAMVLLMVVGSWEASAQDTLYWQNDQKLKWENFQGAPDPADPNDALTTAVIGFKFYVKRDSLVTSVSCFFSGSKSWVRKTSDWVLAHEQVHFDIAELYARKLRKVFSEYKFHAATVRDDMRGMFEEISTERHIMNLEYDQETNHSRIKDKQIFWQQKVQAELDALKEYASS